MKLLIGLAGGIGSGKSSVADFLHKKYGAERLRFSKILSDVLERLDLPRDRRNLQVLGEVLRKSFGGNVIVDAFARDLEGCTADVVVVDGIRFENEVAMLRKFENNVLIYVDASPRVRYMRSVDRGERGEEAKSFEEFMESENMATERNLPQIEKAADHVILNEGTAEELYGKVESVLRDKLN